VRHGEWISAPTADSSASTTNVSEIIPHQYGASRASQRARWCSTLWTTAASVWPEGPLESGWNDRGGSRAEIRSYGAANRQGANEKACNDHGVPWSEQAETGEDDHEPKYENNKEWHRNRRSAAVSHEPPGSSQCFGDINCLLLKCLLGGVVRLQTVDCVDEPLSLPQPFSRGQRTQISRFG
jgi:hypothetical protein